MPEIIAPQTAGRQNRAYDASLAVDREERTIVATINTDALDRYKTVILPEGGQLDNYRKNPVVLCNHGEGSPLPIGKNLWIKVQKRKLIAKTKFLPLGKDPLADKVFDLYDLGFLNAWSISFDPIEAGAPSVDEIRKRPELAECYVIYRRWDLLEYSVVTVPGNPEAVRAAQARGLALPGWPEATAVDLPPLTGARTVTHYLDERRRALRRAARAELVRSIGDAYDLARGKV